MSNFYQRMQQTALRLITSKGQTVVVSTHSEPQYNPVTNEPINSGNDSTQQAQAVVKAIKEQYTAESLVEYGDVEIIIAAKDIEPPKKLDTITANGKKYQVIDVKEINPADLPLVYFCHCRG